VLRLTLTPTLEILTLPSGTQVRLWQGHTADGTPVVAYVAAVGVPPGHDTGAFDRALQSIADPRQPLDPRRN